MRRIHLYSGLLMLPWVLLYGATAMLFNHPTVFCEEQTIPFGPDGEKPSPFGDLPGAGQLACQVTAALQQQEQLAGGSTCYRLVEPTWAYFAGSAFGSAKGPDRRYSVAVDLGDGSALLRINRVPKQANSHPLAAVKPVQLENSMRKRLEAGLTRLLDDLGLEHQEVAFGFVPALHFLLEIDGEQYRVKYDPARGSVTAAEPLPLRQFLLRLHLSHRYPSTVNAQWFWAVAVDAMFVSMLFWGISGLFMGWQIKAVRHIGLAVLLAGTAVAALLFLRMHARLLG